MKPTSIVISGEDWDALRERLFTPDGNENAGVLLCGASESADERRLLVRQVVLAPESAYVNRTGFHLEVAPSFYNTIVGRCLADRLHPVIIHSHRSDGAAWYSSSDDFGEQRLLGVLAALLPHATPASLVLTNHGAIGRQLERKGFTMLASLRVAGAPSIKFDFDRKVRRTRVPKRFERQVRAFGEEGQRRLSGLRVGIVGTGGIGSLVAEQLVRAGVVNFTIVDPDVIEESNVSRLFGASKSDIQQFKANVVARHLGTLGAKRVVAVRQTAIKQSTLLKLRGCDVLFCCVDNDRTRVVLSRFAHQYLIPMIDHGTRLDAREGHITAAAGRVSIVGAGLTCLRCSYHINPERIRAESMSRKERAALAREGYVMGIDEPAPAVVSINTIVGGLGVTAGVNLFVNLTGHIQPFDQIYDARTGSVFPVTPRHEAGCDICDDVKGLKGLGDRQVVSAY